MSFTVLFHLMGVDTVGYMCADWLDFIHFLFCLCQFCREIALTYPGTLTPTLRHNSSLFL